MADSQRFIRILDSLPGEERNFIETYEQRLITQLTSHVAHEIRNPLNGIMAVMGALGKELGDDERFFPYMRHIRNQVSKLTKFMDDLLFLGRQIRKENVTTISAVSVVDNALVAWKTTLSEPMTPIRLKKPDDEGRCMISADVSNLTKAIINLLDNARQRSPAGGEIACEVFCHVADSVVISIKDAGQSIPENLLPAIFDPFLKIRKGETGLELSIVKHIAEIHHGSVFAYNNTDGPGAAFRIILPRSPDEGASSV